MFYLAKKAVGFLVSKEHQLVHHSFEAFGSDAWEIEGEQRVYDQQGQ